jgi:transposase
MLTIPANARLFLCQVPINMRKSFEGLSALVEQMFPGELLSGAFFIFLSRQRNHMKVLYWDGDGLAIFYKRLEKGTFAATKETSSPLLRREFLMLLEGIEPRRLQRRFSL